MKLVIIESPYQGDVEANLIYARACIRDSLMRGEAPIASHLLYTQPGILDDAKPAERQHGMSAGWEWIRRADLVVAYIDRGISDGMRGGLARAASMGVETTQRRLGHK